MEFSQVRLINFCQHRDLLVKLAPGLNGIIGANGSGKSNIINAIRFAITGDNYNIGAKADNVNTLAAKREAAKVSLEFKHAGHAYTLERNLKATKPDATLTRDGQIIALGNAPVTVEMLNILGISLDLFNDVVVAGQDDLYGFISQKPAARAEKFQTLFQTRVSEQVHEATGAWLKTHPPQDHSSNLSDAVAAKDRITVALHEATRLKLQLTDEASLRKMLADAKIASEYAGRLAAVRHYLAAAIDSLFKLEQPNNYQAQTDAARLELSASETKLQHWSDRRADAAARLSLLQGAKDRNAMRASIRQRQAVVFGLSATLKQVTDAELATATFTHNEAKFVYDANAHLRNNLKGDLAKLSADGKCPTCGHVSEDAAQLHHGLADQLAEVIQSGGQLLANWQQAERDLLRLNEAKQDWVDNQVAATSLAEQLSQLAEVDEPIVEVSDAAEVLAAYQSEEKTRNELYALWSISNNALQQWLAMVAGQQTAVAKLQQDLHELEASPVTGDMDPVKVEAAREQLTRHAVLAGEINLRNHETQLIAAQIATWQAICETERLDEQWRAIMDGVRQFTHKTGLPAMVASKNMQTIQNEMNRFLAVFGAAFRAFSSDGVTFIAQFFDGKEQPVERLSGGQKVITALSFRLAVNRLLASNVGLIILDEPTVYQDEHNIQAFAATLERLRQFSATKGLQCIIVTHEKELANQFDNVVQLY